jgi:hypothetical protein
VCKTAVAQLWHTLKLDQSGPNTKDSKSFQTEFQKPIRNRQRSSCIKDGGENYLNPSLNESELISRHEKTAMAAGLLFFSFLLG